MKLTKRDGIDMTQGPLLAKLLGFAFTVTLTGVLQLLFSAADLVVVGRFGSHLSIAAVGSTGSLVGMMISFFLGMSLGAGVTTANAKGSGDKDRVFRAVHTALPVALIGGVAITAAGQIFMRQILSLVDAPEDIIDLSAVYLRIYLCGVIPMMIYNFGAAILRALGDTRHPLIFLIISGVLNFLLNLLFVIVFHMDVAGVALATALSQFLSAALVVMTLRKREDAGRLYLDKLRLYKDELKSIVKVGLPSGIQATFFSSSNVIIQASVNSFDSTVVAGSAAAANIEDFVWWINQGFAQAALNFVGQNMGAKKYDRVVKTVKTALLWAFIFSALFGFGEWLFGRTLLGIYIKSPAEAIEYGMTRLFWVGVFNGIGGLMEVMTGTLRGMSMSIVPMTITVVGVCVTRVVWIYTVFAAHRTLDWLFAAYPIAWLVTVSAEITAFMIIMSRIFAAEKRK